MFKITIVAKTAAELHAKKLEFAKHQLSIEDNEESEIAPVIERANDAPSVKPPIDSFPKMPTARIGLDSRNIPWDERIHSASKSYNKDGTWRTRRNVDNDEVTRIEAELRQANVMATVAVVPTAAPGTTAVIPSEVVRVPIQPVAPIVPMSAPAFIPPQAPQQPIAAPVVAPVVVQAPAPVAQPIGRQAHSYATFKSNLNSILTNLINEGKIDRVYLDGMTKWLKEQFIADGLTIPMDHIWNVIGSEKHTMILFNEFAKHGFITAIEG